ncbi:MAG: 16S rRNA (adenine(1518)-N(6)/adenine(1519)-N(6))-dimethyltransferase RsmA [Betaproteobacteria bacterium]|nr:16S rRNA (adenine(1518)-N(6)/adenine(1519)-N(6))-dimethyltransferase RsmA [Betaproteobacteria bacterium]
MNHRPRKRFGQHFLQDRAIVARIADAIGPRPGETIVEVGPGTGVLTQALLERGAVVQAVEIDRDLAARLRERFANRPLTLHVGDVLKFDLSTFGSAPRIAGNLPYNISTPLLFQIAAQLPGLMDGHFMLQKEVVDRMVAQPSTSEYGRLSVMIQCRFAAEKLFGVPPDAFDPPPKVESAVVRIKPLIRPAAMIEDPVLFGELVTRAFTQRRKMIRNALGSYLAGAQWSAVALDPALRPENLSVEDYARAANYVARQRASAIPE